VTPAGPFARLQGTRVLVIGGSSGIGEATAALAARCGARVTIASRSAARREAALARLPSGVAADPLDVGDASQVEDYFSRRPAWDHVVLAGSATQVGSVTSLPLPQARASMDNKFWGAYHVGRSARVADGGSITFVSGVYSAKPNPQAVLQGALNAAVEALARGLALERAPAVRVNVVSPSTTDTPLWNRLGPDGRAARMAFMRERLPLRRVADAADIAEALLFLAVQANATGATLLVDGGDALV